MSGAFVFAVIKLFPQEEVREMGERTKERREGGRGNKQERQAMSYWFRTSRRHNNISTGCVFVYSGILGEFEKQGENLRGGLSSHVSSAAQRSAALVQ